MWRAGHLDAVESLFTDDAQYRRSPYEEAEVGHAAIYWPGKPCSASAYDPTGG